MPLNNNDNEGTTGSAFVTSLPRMSSNATHKIETSAFDSPEDQQHRDNYMYKTSQDPKCRASTDNAPTAAEKTAHPAA